MFVDFTAACDTMNHKRFSAVYAPVNHRGLLMKPTKILGNETSHNTIGFTWICMQLRLECAHNERDHHTDQESNPGNPCVGGEGYGRLVYIKYILGL